MRFKEWLIIEAQDMKTQLAVFDFDGTIANVPEKPKDKIGWSGKDWWGNEASLSHPFYGGDVNKEVVDAFKEAKSDPSTHAIMLTGRRGVIAHGVRKVLRSHGLYGRRIIPDSNRKEHGKFGNLVANQKDVFHPDEMEDDGHEEYYSGDHRTEHDYPKNPDSKKGRPDGSTMSHKIYIVKKLMHNGFQKVDFWDDRQDHIPHFVQLGQKLLDEWPNLKEVWIHQVFPPASPGEKAEVRHMPLHPPDPIF